MKENNKGSMREDNKEVENRYSIFTKIPLEFIECGKFLTEPTEKKYVTDGREV